MTRILGLFDLIPGWAYAVAIAGVCFMLGLQTTATARAQRDAATARAALATARLAIQTQKTEAAALLAVETARTTAAELALTKAKATQELTDEKHMATIAALDRRLRTAADVGGPALRLRDPHAAPDRCRPDSSSAADAAATAARPGPEDRAQAGGLLSPELTALLLGAADEADALNIAFASCKADAMAIRAQAPAMPP